jgi:Tfp pilus assembly protein PilF
LGIVYLDLNVLLPTGSVFIMEAATSAPESASPAPGTGLPQTEQGSTPSTPSTGSRLRRLMLIIGLLACIAAGATIIFVYYRAERALKLAEKAQAARSFAEARSQLEIYLDLHPNNPDVHFLLARLARQVAQYEEAKRRLDICQQLEGPTARITLERRLIPVQQGAFPVQVEGWLQQLLNEDHPDSQHILEALSRGCMSTYRVHNAKSYLSLWLERDPANVQALLWRASIHQHLMDYERAVEDCRVAAEIAPKDKEAQGRFAQALLQKGEVAEAAKQFAQLYQEMPDNPAIALGMAQCHIKMGRMDEAKEVLDAMLAKNPNDSLALLERGRVALLNNDPNDAKPWLEKAAALAPIDHLTLLTLVQCLKQLSDGPHVDQWQQRLDRIDAEGAQLRELMSTLQKQPYDLKARCEMGRILFRRGEDKQAIEWLKETLSIEPTNEEAGKLLADYYDSQGNPGLAMKYRTGNAPR